MELPDEREQLVPPPAIELMPWAATLAFLQSILEGLHFWSVFVSQSVKSCLQSLNPMLRCSGDLVWRLMHTDLWSLRSLGRDLEELVVASAADVVPETPQLKLHGASTMATAEKVASVLGAPGSTPKEHPTPSIPCEPSQFGLHRTQKTTTKIAHVMLFFRARRILNTNGLNQNGSRIAS